MKRSLYILIVSAVFATSCSLEENTTALSTPDNFFRKYGSLANFRGII